MSENPTFNQINDQQSYAYRHGSSGKPSVLIERPDGRITVGSLDMDTQNVKFKENGEDWMHPAVSLEKLSDEHQQMLAARLAGVALRAGEPHDEHTEKEGADVESLIAAVEQELETLKDSLPDGDKVTVWRYATAVNEQELASAWDQMSEKGRQQAPRYRRLFDQLQKLRAQQ